MPSFSTLVLAALAAVHIAQGASPAISRTARCSSFGNCCSKNGYCGSSKDYCGDGCQTG
ncbi:hypothetical protein SNOG_14429 [Parastagonospora nodorum SN15]|uniref:Chitin-binding type-1 domain-containing protein n=1 Tax=Phaeosphaeria nodorum (strain SN15 / ATCC MYA-4574 / FGSC 10173) TaxID=321614 RepID=Q0U1Q1_PHANO|nr:hypothetical protein SNOG_14429 [Parastagonospora nodorum SN15]EAT78300.1 hypothetical protein SNOG_14429 [Parastagonospora nodorum SN15]